MKKTKKNGSNMIFVLGAVGLAAVGGFVALRGGGLPGFLPTAGGAGSAGSTGGGETGGTGAAGTSYAPDYGVDTGRYYGQSYAEKYASYFPGTVVTSGGATRTPTMSSDPAPTSGRGVDAPVSFGVSYR